MKENYQYMEANVYDNLCSCHATK